MRMLMDSQAVLEQVNALCVNGQVQGGQVHDARIAACCLTHGVRVLWTIDRDFSRFPSLKTANPLTE